jgi:hypothetical protein
MNEKIKAVELLAAALKQVDAAMDAIEAFADAYDLPKPGSTIPLEELAYLVSKKTGASPFCAEETIRSAFHLMKDLDLRVEDREEDEDDE